jgi:hypothetical protein
MSMMTDVTPPICRKRRIHKPLAVELRDYGGGKAGYPGNCAFPVCILELNGRGIRGSTLS